MPDFQSYDLHSLYSGLLEPFRNPDFGPILATVLLFLAVVVLAGFLCFAVPQAFRLRAALAVIKGGTDNESEQQKRTNFVRDYEKINDALLSNKATSSVWQEFRKCLIGGPQRSIILNSTPPNNFFNARNLRAQYDFVRSLPNFFVGLGLLGTFIGLIAALTFSSQNLTGATNQEEIKQALNGLLTTAAAKFYISAAGLISSLALSLVIKLSLKRLHGLIHQINNALEERTFFVSPQTISERQLSVQQESLGELKLFNTNIAMKIGDAVRTAVEASNESVTNKLSEIASSFGKLLDSSRDGAGNAINEALKGALDSSLQRAGEAIGSVASSLQGLPDRLSGAAAAIQEAGNVAARQQERLSETIQSAVEKILRDTAGQVSTSIESGTQNVIAGLKETGSTFGASATKIVAFLERFETSGTGYLESLSSLAEQNTKLESNLTSISSQIIAASEGITKATSAANVNLESVLKGFGEFTRTAAQTSQSVRESQASILKTVETLQQQMGQHIQRFNNVDEKLAGIFSSISSHIELQAKQMAEQFTRMDQALASAVNQFEQLIDDLTEASATRAAAE